MARDHFFFVFIFFICSFRLNNSGGVPTHHFPLTFFSKVLPCFNLPWISMAQVGPRGDKAKRDEPLETEPPAREPEVKQLGGGTKVEE